MKEKRELLIAKGSREIMHFLLLLAFAFACILAANATANADTVKEVREANDLLDQGPGNYKLMNNVVISDTWNVSGASELDLNGYGLIIQTNTSAICVGSNATLTLNDSNANTDHIVKLEDWRGTGVDGEGWEPGPIDENGNGYVGFKGGFITGGVGKDDVGSVSDLAGGGIVVAGGNLTEEIPGGHVIMNAGTIIGNKSVSQDFDYGGGGVFVDAQGKFEMKGGMISSNHADLNGGGVGLHGSGQFIQTGGQISRNNAVGNGGGVYAAGGYGKFTLNGGKIERNTASLGGGVCVRGHGVFEMLSGSVSNNSASGYGGGIYLQRDGDAVSGTGEINISGGSIDKNTAKERGGGVYFMEGVFKLSGNPEINNNVIPIADGSSTAPSNVAMYETRKITITGELSNETPIGIDRNEGVFTEGLNEKGDKTHFTSNREGLGVDIVSDGPSKGEAHLGTDEWKSLQYALKGVRDGDIFNVRDYDFNGDYKITAGEDDTCLEIWGEEEAKKKVTLNLNGITLDRGLSDKEANTSGYVLKLYTELDLTIIGTSVENHVGTITGGNSKDSFSGGGGIIVGTYVDLTLQDVKVIGNKTTGQGGGIYVAGNLALKGATEVTGNKKITDNDGGEIDNNVYLPVNNNVANTINVLDDLTNAKGDMAQIGITAQRTPTGEKPTAITGKIPNPYSVASRFTSDVSDYIPIQHKAIVYLAVPVKVTYDKNHAEAKGEMETQIMGGSLSAYLDENTFTCGRRGFKGWNTKADGSGTAYKDQQEVTFTEDTTLYAQWTPDISATVTFKVVNGSWNDGSTGEKKVTLKGIEGDTLKLTADQIPAAGNKPGKGYKAGSWNKVPDTNTAITGDTAYTYTYEAEEEPTPTPAPKEKVNKPIAKMTAKGKTSQVLTWTKVKGAKGYDVFFAKCSKDCKNHKYKRVKTIKAFKKLRVVMKKLKPGTPYKFYVKAWVKKNGKKKYIATSTSAHSYTSNGSEKYTNAKKIKVKKAKVTLKKGKTFKIKAKIVKFRKNKKLIQSKHAPALRYMSSDSSIATVSKSGKIKAKGSGSCKIYVFAANGVNKAIKVKVK